MVLTSTGPLVQRLGSLAGVLAYEASIKSSEAYQLYQTTSTDDTTGDLYENLYQDYQAEYGTYIVSAISSYSFWGLGGMAGYLLFPYEELGFSTLGRVVFASSFLFDAIGNMLSLVSKNADIDATAKWNEYLTADTNLDALYEDFEQTYGVYAVSRTGSFISWTLATAGMAVAPFLGAEKTKALDGVGHSLLYGIGNTLLSLANISSAFSVSLRNNADQIWNSYMQATEDIETKFAEYEAAYVPYLVSTIGSYALWAAGIVTTTLALFLPPSAPDTEAEESVVQPLFYIAPYGDGVQAGIRLKL